MEYAGASTTSARDTGAICILCHACNRLHAMRGILPYLGPGVRTLPRVLCFSKHFVHGVAVADAERRRVLPPLPEGGLVLRRRILCRSEAHLRFSAAACTDTTQPSSEQARTFALHLQMQCGHQSSTGAGD